jgi:hypothetical protein
MSDSNIFSFSSPISRRKALALGGTLAGGLVAASVPAAAILRSGGSQSILASSKVAASSSTTSLPVNEIEEIIGAEGTVSNGVLSIQVDRDDLHVVGTLGDTKIPFKPSWEINHEFYFQSLGDGTAIFNGDICVLDDESNHTIDRIIQSGLTFMAFHQHFFDLRPQVWFQHFRGVGDPIALAKAIRYVLGATGTPLPQPASSNSTPLDADRLGNILGGEANVEGDGVVTVDIPRKESITLAGHHVESELGILTTVAFEPLHKSDYCAVAPDFALLGKEVNPVFQIMRSQGWEINCLYNQETDEHPQFYFSHQLKLGNAYDLAAEIRRGLDLTNSKLQ